MPVDGWIGSAGVKKTQNLPQPLLTRRNLVRYSARVAGVPAAVGTKREGRENRPRTRRCNRRRPPQQATAAVRSGSGKARRKDDPEARRPACDQPGSAFASRGAKRLSAFGGLTIGRRDRSEAPMPRRLNSRGPGFLLGPLAARRYGSQLRSLRDGPETRFRLPAGCALRPGRRPKLGGLARNKIGRRRSGEYAIRLVRFCLSALVRPGRDCSAPARLRRWAMNRPKRSEGNRQWRKQDLLLSWCSLC